MIHYSCESARAQAPVEDSPFHRYTFDDGTVWTEFFRTENGYLLRFPGLADFTVSGDGNSEIGVTREARLSAGRDRETADQSPLGAQVLERLPGIPDDLL